MMLSLESTLLLVNALRAVGHVYCSETDEFTELNLCSEVPISIVNDVPGSKWPREEHAKTLLLKNCNAVLEDTKEHCQRQEGDYKAFPIRILPTSEASIDCAIRGTVSSSRITVSSAANRVTFIEDCWSTGHHTEESFTIKMT